MHPAAVLILVLYLLEEIVALLLNLLNINHLKRHGQKVPAGFEEYVDLASLRRICQYTVARSRLACVASVFSGCATVVFFFTGLLDKYNGWLVALVPLPWARFVLFFLLLLLASTALQLPFDLYSTFKIEERFGFNRQTAALWLSDLVKNLLLSSVLVSGVLAVGSWFISRWPTCWWFFFWLLMSGFSLALMYLLPYVIEPMFNTFVPVTVPALVERLRQLMVRAGLHISRVMTMDASKRSGHSNAYFSGIGRVKRIVLFDTLLDSHSHEEIAAILAHEAGHWKKKHVLQGLLLGQMLLLGGCYLLFFFSSGDWLLSVFAVSYDGLEIRILLAGFCLVLLTRPLTPLWNHLSRYYERQADAFAVKLMGDSRSLASALAKLGADNLANLHPHPLYAAMYYSHPPLAERVQRLLAEDRMQK